MKVYNPTQSIKDTQMIHDVAYIEKWTWNRFGEMNVDQLQTVAMKCLHFFIEIMKHLEMYDVFKIVFNNGNDRKIVKNW